jgi:hypothetical protein
MQGENRAKDWSVIRRSTCKAYDGACYRASVLYMTAVAIFVLNDVMWLPVHHMDENTKRQKRHPDDRVTHTMLVLYFHK